MARGTGKNNVVAFWLALVSAVFLFVSGTTGVGTWTKIANTVSEYAEVPYINIVFGLVLLVASLGAVTVLAGGILILKRSPFLGRTLVFLGSGAGSIGFLINLYLTIKTHHFSPYAYLSFSSLGLMFAIAAQLVSINIRKSWWYRRLKRPR